MRRFTNALKRLPQGVSDGFVMKFLPFIVLFGPFIVLFGCILLF